MMVKKTVTLKCPYCGNTWQQTIKLEITTMPILTWCDVDESPGCGSWFAYIPKVDVTFEYYELTKKEQTQ